MKRLQHIDLLAYAFPFLAVYVRNFNQDQVQREITAQSCIKHQRIKHRLDFQVVQRT
ncbi:uncharacterized protein J3R85_008597 [Psidium guajava]|nr:uncharacterized protein J3R85_008597 [Psidium guajava]